VGEIDREAFAVAAPMKERTQPPSARGLGGGFASTSSSRGRVSGGDKRGVVWWWWEENAMEQVETGDGGEREEEAKWKGMRAGGSGAHPPRRLCGGAVRDPRRKGRAALFALSRGRPVIKAALHRIRGRPRGRHVRCAFRENAIPGCHLLPLAVGVPRPRRPPTSTAGGLPSPATGDTCMTGVLESG
jgi:hypothetical protein